MSRARSNQPGAVARIAAGLLSAVLAAFCGGCSSSNATTPLERVRLPRAIDETATEPPLAARWSTHGILTGGLEFDRVTVFLPPNQYAERTTLRGVDVVTTRLWDGAKFFERSGETLRKLEPQAARALFDRAMEAAVLFRLSDVQPSLAVERVTTGSVDGALPVDVYRISHGRAGFDRALDFDGETHRLIALRGSRHVEGKPLPLDCEVAYSEHRVIAGRSLPFAYSIGHAGEVLESGVISDYRIDDLPSGADLLALLEAN